MPFDLLQLSTENGIHIEFYNFKSPTEAIYVSTPNYPPLIVLSKKLYSSCSHLRSVWAHELGHHFTASKSTVQEVFQYTDRIDCDREECRAWRWAVNYLVPEDKLTAVIDHGIVEPWELAEFFGVDQKVIDLRFEFIKQKRMIM